MTASMLRITFLIAFFLSSNLGLADNAFWVFFNTKGEVDCGLIPVSEATLENRKMLELPLCQFSDFPVLSIFLDSLINEGVTVNYASKWLNAAHVQATRGQLERVNEFSFVDKVLPAREVYFASYQSNLKMAEYGYGMEQIKVAALEEYGLDGSGVKIGVIDGGFMNADKVTSLRHVFEEKRVEAYRDYLNPGREEFFSRQAGYDDWHGTEVWQLIAGFDRENNRKYGAATGASFFLACTDHGKRENRGEEYNWIAAMEWMDSLGVRLVNTSLGYSTGFDDPSENYQFHQMDGRTTLISLAAQKAVEEKGMILVVSAGNSGHEDNWKVVCAPADAQGVVSVGATNFNPWDKAHYSSEGPGFISYLKPDVSCFASSGTSFAAPIITGLLACVLQKEPYLTPDMAKAILHQSSHLYPYGNNFLGYGVPDAGKLLSLVEKKNVESKKEIIEVKAKKWKYMGAKNSKLVVFHKSDHRMVIQQKRQKAGRKKTVIRKINESKYSTVVDGNMVLEIFWK
jgi:subtilisin family serine protease